jgi:hypothetical protein
VADASGQNGLIGFGAKLAATGFNGDGIAHGGAVGEKVRENWCPFRA